MLLSCEHLYVFFFIFLCTLVKGVALLHVKVTDAVIVPEIFIFLQTVSLCATALPPQMVQSKSASRLIASDDTFASRVFGLF